MGTGSRLKNRQKVRRELTATQKVLGALDLIVRQWDQDAAAVTVGEVNGLSKKPQPHVSEDIRWVHHGEELNMEADGKGDDCGIDVKERMNMLAQLQEGEAKQSSILFCLKAMVATPKDPGHFGIACFTQYMKDAVRSNWTPSQKL